MDAETLLTNLRADKDGAWCVTERNAAAVEELKRRGLVRIERTTTKLGRGQIARQFISVIETIHLVNAE